MTANYEVEAFDEVLSFPMPDIEDAMRKLQHDLHEVATWCCENDLLINPDKTKFLPIGTRQLMDSLESTPSVSFLGKRLYPAASAMDLGVSLDPNLTYNNHISKVVSSCFSKLCQINRVRSKFVDAHRDYVGEILVKKIAKEGVYAAMTTPSLPESLKLVTDLQNQDPPATSPRARKSFQGKLHYPQEGVSVDSAPYCNFDTTRLQPTRI